MKGKTWILTGILLALAVGTPAGAAKKAAISEDEFTRARDRVARLHEDISTINLLNGLNLTRDQMTQILGLARETRRVRDQATVQSRETMETLRQAEEAFTALRAEVQRGAPARGAAPARAAQVNHRLKELKDQAQQQLAGELQSLEERLTRVLTPEQVQVVENFKPCLIPPHDLRDPVRAGQAASTEGVVKNLKRLRDIPEDKWRTRGPELVRRLVDRFSDRHFRLTEEEKQKETARLLALADRVRALPEVDFQMEKEKLAAELKPGDRLQVLRAELERRLPGEGRPKLSRVGRFLLGGRVIPILEERLAASR